MGLSHTSTATLWISGAYRHEEATGQGGSFEPRATLATGPLWLSVLDKRQGGFDEVATLVLVTSSPSLLSSLFSLHLNHFFYTMLFRRFASFSLYASLFAARGAFSLPLDHSSSSLLTDNVAPRVSWTFLLKLMIVFTILPRKGETYSFLIARSGLPISKTSNRIKIADIVNEKNVDPIQNRPVVAEVTPVSTSPLPLCVRAS